MAGWSLAGFCPLLPQALWISATPTRFWLVLPQALRISWDFFRVSYDFLPSQSGWWILISVDWLLGLLVIIDWLLGMIYWNHAPSIFLICCTNLLERLMLCSFNS
jgi:hypothetical protein